MPALITEDSVLPLTFNPVVLIFKDEGDLAKHPLSCQPHRMFSGRENARKGDKVRESCKGEKAESFGANFIDKTKSVVTCT